MSKHHTVKWVDHMREPQCAPNPAYPDGVHVVLTSAIDAPHACKVELPYPAKRCGYYEVRCSKCGYSAAITTAGRPDDPRSVVMPCDTSKLAQEN